MSGSAPDISLRPGEDNRESSDGRYEGRWTRIRGSKATWQPPDSTIAAVVRGPVGASQNRTSFDEIDCAGTASIRDLSLSDCMYLVGDAICISSAPVL
jgi:hypothetical protein